MAVEGGLEGKAVAVLPVASYENHGVLPLESDLLIADCVSRRVLQVCGEHVTVLPAIPYSVSVEHLRPRVTVSPSVFIDYLYEVIVSVLETFKALVVAVFHGGAYHTAYAAARVARSRGFRVLLFNFWRCVSRALKEKYGVDYSLIHADPVEASILLACGYGGGVRASETGYVVDVLRSLEKRRRVVLEPWVYSDVEDLYPRGDVPASKELGLEILEQCSGELCRLAMVLGGSSD